MFDGEGWGVEKIVVNFREVEGEIFSKDLFFCLSSRGLFCSITLPFFSISLKEPL
jgi:hypothetical protein